MNKIINQKRYDTDAAKKIGKKENVLPTDLYYTCETLYRKKTGEFFLLCEGGPASMYGKWSENEGHYGKTIKPLSYEQSENWAKKNLDGDTYEKLFGIIDETDEMETFSIAMPVSTASRLRKIASQTGKLYGDIITDLLDGKISDKS